MNLKTWLSNEPGRATALAGLLGVSKARITYMMDSGVPIHYLFAVRDCTLGAVTVEEMVAERTPPELTKAVNKRRMEAHKRLLKAYGLPTEVVETVNEGAAPRRRASDAEAEGGAT